MNFDAISAYATPEESPGFLLWRVSTLWRRSIEDVLKPLDLTHPQFVVLATTGWLIKAQEKVSQIDISKLAGLDPNTTSQILRSLEAKKFIIRSHSIDERSKYPQLTKEGANRLVKALPLVEQADAEFFSSVDLKKSGILKALQTLQQKPIQKT